MPVAGTLYDSLLGDRGTITYSANGIDYPDSNQINVFGPVYAPRVYGKDLGTLEIASSGKISYSVQDVHSLQLDRTLATSNVTLSTLCNDTFNLTVNGGLMGLHMDATNNNIVLQSEQSINEFAASNFGVYAGPNSNMGITMVKDTMDMTLYAASNVRINASGAFIVNAAAVQWGVNGSYGVSSSGTLIMASSSDVLVNGDNQSLLIAGGAASNAFMQVTNTSNALLFTKNDATINALDDVFINAARNVAVTASNNFSAFAVSNMTLTANQDYATAVGRDATVDVGRDLTLAASNNLRLTAAGASASFSNYAATLSVTSNLTLTTQRDLTITSGNLTTLTSSNEVSVTSMSNVIVSSAAATIVTSSNNVTITSQSNVTVTSKESTLVTSSCNVTITASNNVLVTSAAATTVDSASNVTVTAAKDVVIKARANTLVDANSNLLVTAGGDTRITATGQIVMGTSNNFVRAVFDPAGIYTVVAGAQSNSLMQFDNTYKITTYSASNITITTSNDLDLAASKFFNMTGSNVTLTGTSQTIINAGQSSIKMLANGDAELSASNYSFFAAGGAKMVEIYNDKVVINGNMQLKGTLDTINITDTNLFIQDRTIELAHTSNDLPPTDGLVNDKSGVRVAGLPSVVSGSNLTASQSNIYTKSLLWNTGVTGIPSLGSVDADKESYWELKGGSFRITHTKTELDPNGAPKEVSFGLRVNHLDELELVKRSWTASGYVMRRIAKFGRTLN